MIALQVCIKNLLQQEVSYAGLVLLVAPLALLFKIVQLVNKTLYYLKRNVSLLVL